MEYLILIVLGAYLAIIALRFLFWTALWLLITPARLALRLAVTLAGE